MKKILRAAVAASVLALLLGAPVAWPARVIDGNGIVLYVSMAPVGRGDYGDSCGSLDDSSITANVGDHVHICYTGQNNTSDTLTIHSIANSVDGDLFTDFSLDIGPGGQQLLADFRATVTTSMDITHTWTARVDAGSPLLTATTETHITANAPTLTLPTPAIVASAAGTVVTQPFSIVNDGTGDLAWHFGEAAMPAGLDPGSIAPLRHAIPPTQYHATPQPSGTTVVPSFAVEVTPSGTQFVALDLANPTDATPITSTLPGAIGGGTFVDGDFGHVWLLSDDAGLVTVDTATGVIDIVNAATAPDAGDTGWLGLAWDPVGRALYALSTNGVLPSLYEIDPVNGATTRLGEINDRTLTINGVYTALAADADGRLFAIDATNDLLVAVARDRYSLDGRASGYTVGRLGVDVVSIAGLAFDAATNTLYLSAVDATSGEGAMYTVDTVTGAATSIAPLGNATSYIAIAADASRRPCGVAGDVDWLSLDTYIEPPQAPGVTSVVDAILDATELEPGAYDAYLCLHTNDATRTKVPIPVHLDVGGSDAIFANAFDGGAR